MYLFIYLNVGHAKRKKGISLDSQMENHSKKNPVPCWEQEEEEYINFKLIWFFKQAYDSLFLSIVHMNCLHEAGKTHILISSDVATSENWGFYKIKVLKNGRRSRQLVQLA